MRKQIGALTLAAAVAIGLAITPASAAAEAPNSGNKGKAPSFCALLSNAKSKSPSLAIDILYDFFCGE